MTELIILLYLLTVLGIGWLSNRRFRGTGEDYFLASRSIGPFVLLMSLFGTHMTAFSLLGASGEAYNRGIGVFGLMASSSAVVVPFLFFLIGVPLWKLGEKRRFLTQIQFFRERWDSQVLGFLLFLVIVALMIPYLLIGVMGGGITLFNITEGRVPEWVGGLLVCAVIFTYVSAGGVRGTAWVNTFQTLVFMVLGALTFGVVLNKLGGLQEALATVARENPQLLVRGESFPIPKYMSYMLIPMSVAMFPHIFMHWLTAKSSRSFRVPMLWYPVCIAIVWLPSVLLGIMGTLDFPGLNGPAANSVLVKMVAAYAPGVLGGLLGAGVFAAIMSSLDSQTLAVGTMFTQDVMKGFLGKNLSPEQEVWWGRGFVLAILSLIYLISLVADRSIFGLAVWSFSGFSALLPVVVAALYWRRSTALGAILAVALTGVSWLYFFLTSAHIPGYSVGSSGVMPVAVMLLLSTLGMIGGSLVSPAPSKSRLDKFFTAP
ncbi:MAG TPA: sodium:solute symporter family protein [Calditrichia bacterium]|nr:sodium:solute symporter family protein [Calditrichota bacterium]HQV32724.1 sodium:solute symporter family protein [Calditrichia bacterium]